MTYWTENRRWWGWGREDVDASSTDGLTAFLQARISPWPDWILPVPDPDDLDLRPSCLPDSLIHGLSSLLPPDGITRERRDRLLHAAGRSYRDLIRLRLGRALAPPDVVVFPSDHGQVVGIIEVAKRHRAALVPFGGGSSVVGGIEPSRMIRPLISVDLTRMNRVLSIDPPSMTAHVQAGIFGPDLEKALNGQGVTLGHFPQSFEYSTLGGWIATRGAGFKSNLYGKIEDMVLSLHLAAPEGDLTTPRSPARAAGGDPTGLLIGSEGALGIITEAEIKLKPLPEREWQASWFFPDFQSGLRAVQKMAAQGTKADFRLSDGVETAALLAEARSKGSGVLHNLLHDRALPRWLGLHGIEMDRACLLLIMGEGDHAAIGPQKKKADRCCKEFGGLRAGASPARAWRESRYQAPYLRDDMITRGLMVDTLETAGTWDRLPDLYQAVRVALEDALEWSGVRGVVMAHLSHSYAQGANLYFTFIAPQVRGREEEQWWRVKRAATDAIMASGGALSHHHGVGRDHKPWWRDYWGDRLAEPHQSAKDILDPACLLNPGVISDPRPDPSRWGSAFGKFSPQSRSDRIKDFSEQAFDLVVIGGGIVGAGVAWDAALRGLSVALMEKGDFGSGTSGKSSRMIHGGLRYLKSLDLKLVRESLAERHHLMKMAPHLVQPREHLMPVYKGEGEGKTVLHIGLWSYDALAGSKGLPSHQVLSAEEVLEKEPSIKPQGLEGGLVYYDCLTDDARLTLEVIKAAQRNGAVAVNYVKVVKIDYETDGAVVRFKDLLTGRESHTRAKVVVNAAGIWSDAVRSAADPNAGSIVRPAKGVHIVFPRTLKPIQRVVILKGADGRPLFAVPSGQVVYVGTTDTDYDGDPNEVHADAEEVQYLIDAVNRAFDGPSLTGENLSASWAGVRPLILGDSRSREAKTKDISREHEIRTEQSGLLTVCGGKLTTFRVMAAQTVDRVMTILSDEEYAPSVTADMPICGIRPEFEAAGVDMPPLVRQRLEQKYGPHASTMEEYTQSPVLAALLDESTGLTAAEVFYAVGEEMAMTLCDVMVRRLGMTYTTADCGLKVAPMVADIMAPLLKWSDKEKAWQVQEYQDYVGREIGFKSGLSST